MLIPAFGASLILGIILVGIGIVSGLEKRERLHNRVIFGISGALLVNSWWVILLAYEFWQFFRED